MTVAIDLGSYADISDYGSLVDKVRLWLDRGSDLDPQMPTFVSLLEPYFNRVLRTPEMETVAYPVITDGGFPLPVDCLAVRGVSLNGRGLDAMSPAQLQVAFGTPGGIINGCASAYAVTGRNVAIGPIAPGVATLVYWQRIPALTFANPTNWLLTAHPDVYLYGALAQAYGYINEPAERDTWTALFEGAVGSLMESASKARYGGPIRQRAVTQVRGVRA